MAQKITVGPNDWFEIISTEEGPKRKFTGVSFFGRGDSGDVSNLHFPGTGNRNLVGVIDMKTGTLRSADYTDTGNALGTLKVQDTGHAASDGSHMIAFFTDTGL